VSGVTPSFCLMRSIVAISGAIGVDPSYHAFPAQFFTNSASIHEHIPFPLLCLALGYSYFRYHKILAPVSSRTKFHTDSACYTNHTLSSTIAGTTETDNWLLNSISQCIFQTLSFCIYFFFWGTGWFLSMLNLS